MIPVCPRCDAALFILEFKGVEVDFCHHCRGLWLDAGELETLLEHTGADAQDPLLSFQREPGKRIEGRNMLCPRCDRPLLEIDARRDAQTVKIDRCAQGHGLWFDHAELRQLLALFQPSSGASKTVAYLNELLGGDIPTKGETQ